MFHSWLLCFLRPITVLLAFLFVDTFIPMDTYMNKSCMIGSVHISTIVHPLREPLVYSIFSVSSGVLRNIFVNSVNSVSPKFGTMRSWGGATHKLKPSPFRQLRFSGPTPCSVLPLNKNPIMNLTMNKNSISITNENPSTKEYIKEYLIMNGVWLRMRIQLWTIQSHMRIWW